MRTYLRRSWGMLALAGLLAGCGDFLTGPGLDFDPNRPVAATRDQRFVGMQVRQFTFHTGHMARTAGLWTQQFAGTDRQYLFLNLYYFTEDEFNDPWSAVYSGGGLLDTRAVIADADAAGDRVYAGIARVWEAFGVGMAASLWGDIPYSQVGDFAARPTPPLDRQEEVYAAVQAVLDRAIQDLGSGAGRNPATLDLIYGGNAQRWIEVAHTLKARFYLHWTEAQSAGEAAANVACNGNCVARAIQAAQNGISSPANDFRTLHSAAAGEENLWHQFMFRERDTYLRAGDFLVELLKERNDPRLSEYFAPTAAGTFVGAFPWSGDTGASLLSFTRGSAGFRQPVLTYAENQLILAEAYHRQNQFGQARTHLNNARRAAGLQDVGGGVTGAALFEEIATEKYIALFQNIEVYNDFRRLCLPEIEPVEDVFEIPFPWRPLYPVNERNANPRNIPPPAQQPELNRNIPRKCFDTLS